MRVRNEAVAAVAAFLARAGVAAADAVAVGWATVDLERAATDLAPGVGLVPLAEETLLGARAARIADGDGPALVLLEPVTEGRLAATLARHGEGAAVVWVTAGARIPATSDAATSDADTSTTATPFTSSRAASGPFGGERLVLGGPIHGPHVLVVEEGPGTIRP